MRLRGRDFVAREQKGFATAEPIYRVRAVAAAHEFSLRQPAAAAHPERRVLPFLVWRLRSGETAVR